MFMRAFLRKGKLSNLLSRIPVHVILNSRTALLGAAQYGIDLRMTGENS
ncbi:MAG: glucokinase [Candidatus Bathyarchaeia archaeon]